MTDQNILRSVEQAAGAAADLLEKLSYLKIYELELF
jgi:hypothetical protein